MDPRTRVSIAALTVLLLWNGAPPLRADEATDQYAVAAAHYAAHRWDLAATEFRTLLDRFPLSARANEARYFLGESLVQSHHFRQAAEVFGQLLDKQPEPQIARRAVFRQGEALHLAGDATAAEPVLRMYLQQYSEDPSAVHALCYHGATLLALQKPADALKQFDVALARISTGNLAEMCQLGKAQAAEQLKRNDDAARGYQSLLTAKSINIAQQARLRLGMLQSSRGQFASAVSTLKPLTELAADHPTRDEARYWMALSLLQAGHHQAALDIFKPWTEQAGPRADEACYRAGLAFMALGQKEAARVSLKKVAADSPWGDVALSTQIQIAASEGNDPLTERLQAEFNRRYPQSPRTSEVAEVVARRLAQSDKHREAIRLLQSRLGDGRKDSDADRRRRYLLALSFVAERQFEDALRELDLVLRSKDSELKARALQSQGTILMTLGRHNEAIAPLIAGLELRPEGQETIACRGNLAICYARSGRLAEARELDRQLQKSPGAGNGVISLSLADAALAAGQRDWAESLWRRVADSEAPQSQRVQALYELARSQMQANRAADAEATCQRICQLNPAMELAAQARLLQGAALEKLNRKDEALSAYRNILEQADSAALPIAMMRSAHLEEGLGRRNNAVKLYDRLTKEFPRSAEADAALYQAAWLLQGEGKETEANARFGLLNQQHPRSRYWADATYRLAAAALKDQQNDAVRCHVTSLAEADATPPDVLAHAFLLDIQRSVAEGNWSDVQNSAGELTKRLPQSKLVPVAEFWLAEAAYRQQNTDEATRRFNGLATRTFQGRQAWQAIIPLRQGQLAAAARDWPTARNRVELLRSQWPGCEQQQEVDYLWGRCLSAEARFDEARGAYALVIASSAQGKTETAAMAQWMMGETYLHQKRYDEAIREYLRVEALYGYPKWQAAALLEAGKCYSALGRHADAAEIYQRILDKYSRTMFCDEARQRLRADASPKSGGVTAKQESAGVTPPSTENAISPRGTNPREAAVPSTSQGRTPPR